MTPEAKPAAAARRWLAASLAAVLALQFGRSLALLAAPRFWAEEGEVHFAFAFREGFLASLLAPQLGYFALVPNLGAALAQLVPLERAPFVTTYLALAVQLGASALVFAVPSRLWDSPPRRLAVAVAIPLVAPGEVWLTTIAAQFWLCVATFLVLQDEGETTSRRRAWGLRALLATAGLTGVASCFLTPFFLWRAQRSGQREHRVRALVLVAACLVQLAVFASALAGRDAHLRDRFSTSELSPLELLVWHVAFPVTGIEFLGWDWVQRLDHAFRAGLPAALSPAPGALPRLSLLLVLATVGGVLAALSVAGLRDRARRPLWLAWLAVVALSTATSIHFASSPRYAFAPNLFLAVLLLDEARAGRPAWRRRTVAALLAVALASNLAGYRSRLYDSPHWPRWGDEVAHWRQDPAYRPRIWPQSPEKSWRVELTPRE